MKNMTLNVNGGKCAKEGCTTCICIQESGES